MAKCRFTAVSWMKICQLFCFYQMFIIVYFRLAEKIKIPSPQNVFSNVLVAGLSSVINRRNLFRIMPWKKNYLTSYSTEESNTKNAYSSRSFPRIAFFWSIFIVKHSWFSRKVGIFNINFLYRLKSIPQLSSNNYPVSTPETYIMREASKKRVLAHLVRSVHDEFYKHIN